MSKTVAEKLANELVNSEQFTNAYEQMQLLYSSKLFELEKLSVSDLELDFDFLLRCAYILSLTQESQFRNIALNIVATVNRLSNDPFHNTSIYNTFTNLGNFPAKNVLGREKDNYTKVPLEREIYETYKKLRNTVPNTESLYFTDTQLKIYNMLTTNKMFSFSGPTSIGKSFLIKNFIRHVLHNAPKENIVALVPTKALINQYVEDINASLGEELKRFNYKVSVSSIINTQEDSNLLLVLTPERLIRYLANKENNPPLGFLFVDEAHKITTKNDVRSIVTFRAIEKAINRFPAINLYFASPFVKNPDVYLELFSKNKGKSFSIDENTVSQYVFKINFKENIIYQNMQGEFRCISDNLNDFATNYIELVHKIGQYSNSLVYCHSVASVVENAKKLAEYVSRVEKVEPSPKLKSAIDKIKGYIHKDYYLAKFLSLGIAFHYGKLPQEIRLIIEDLYKQNEIRYMFTTSTLLEGINLPTTNLFILSNKKGLAKLDELDFWNLSGRAGRTNIELIGNVFYIQNEKDTSLEKPPSKDINVEPTITDKLERNRIKLTKVLEGNPISGTQSEKEQIKYISNIICVDTIGTKRETSSYTLNKIKTYNSSKILTIAEEKVKDIVVPYTILGANEWIDVDIQNKVYTTIKSNPVTLPETSINYPICMNVLKYLNDLYQLEHIEKNFDNSNKLTYYGALMNQWIGGANINRIILNTIKWYSENEKTMYEYGQPVGVFDKNNEQHINSIIIGVLNDIEDILRFTLEKYFNHYHQTLSYIVGEDKAGPNWAKYIEYGTTNMFIIALQDLGLSRYTAQYIFKNFFDLISLDENQQISINIKSIVESIDPDSIAYMEISKLLIR